MERVGLSFFKLFQNKNRFHQRFYISQSGLICVQLKTHNTYKYTPKRYNPQKHLPQTPKPQKKSLCKYQKTSLLKNTFKKDCKRPCLSQKSVYFCTRNDGDVLRNPDKPNELKRVKLFSKKIQKKFVRFENGCYLCTPQNRVTLFEKLIRKKERIVEKIFSKKLFKKLVRIKRSCTFAPANREASEKEKDTFLDILN